MEAEILRPGRLRVGLVVMVHPFEVGASSASKVLQDARATIDRGGWETVVHPTPVSSKEDAKAAGQQLDEKGVHVMVVHLATWCDDRLLLEAVSRCKVPVVNWSIQDVNSGSLCGGQQFNMVLFELGLDTTFVLTRDSSASGEEFARLKKAICQSGERHLARWHREKGSGRGEVAGSIIASVGMDGYKAARRLVEELEHLTVGIIGNRTQGMMEVACDEFSVKSVIGPVVVSVSLHELEEIAAGIPASELREARDQFLARRAGIMQEVSDRELMEAIKVFVAIERVVDEHGLGAITIDCYPRYMGRACVALSILADRGVPSACEGDVHSAILAWVLANITGEPVNHIDVLDVFDAPPAPLPGESGTGGKGIVVGGHCGSCSVRLAPAAKQVRLTSVRLAGTGACLTFPQKPGPVVMACLVGRKGTYRACVLQGDVLDPKDAISRERADFPGATAVVRLAMPSMAFLEMVTRNGFGHHWIVAPDPTGVARGILEAVFTLLGIKKVP